jgi:hypothetical protein
MFGKILYCPSLIICHFIVRLLFMEFFWTKIGVFYCLIWNKAKTDFIYHFSWLFEKSFTALCNFLLHPSYLKRAVFATLKFVPKKSIFFNFVITFSTFNVLNNVNIFWIIYFWVVSSLYLPYQHFSKSFLLRFYTIL